MTNRLPYETSGGNLTPTETFRQFIEYLSLAEEEAHTLSNLAKVRNNLAIAKGWSRFANNFLQVRAIVIDLAGIPANSLVEYTNRSLLDSEAEVYTRLLEHLRLGEEAVYILGHYYKSQDDFSRGQGMLAVGEMLKMTQINVTNLATRGLRTKGGFR